MEPKVMDYWLKSKDQEKSLWAIFNQNWNGEVQSKKWTNMD